MALSRIGTLGLVWLVLALIAAIAIRRPMILPLVGVGLGSANLIASALKAATGVERPPSRYASPEALVRVPTDGSFPSGHAATGFCAAALLARFVPRFAVVLYALAGAIAFSRVYVGVHYPLDVVAGAVLGLAVATALLRLVAARPRSPRGPPAG